MKGVGEIAAELLRSADPNIQERGLELLRQETLERPQDSKAWFEYAGGFDYLGREAEALPRYEKVRELGLLGLPAEDQPRWFIQTGSTLRNLKRFDDARRVLKEGLANHPDCAAIKAFLGLVEYSDGHYREAARLFLQAGVGSPGDSSMRDYSRALNFYSGKLDEYPARQRNWMRIHLTCLPELIACEVEHPFEVISVRLEHADALGELMHSAYHGSVDDQGESPEQCLEEMRGTLAGKYGELIEGASFAAFSGERAVSATIVTFWKGKALLAFTMTTPEARGRSLARQLILRSMAALKEAGHRDFHLVVTEGNVSAEALYRRLGFELLGPTLPAPVASAT